MNFRKILSFSQFKVVGAHFNCISIILSSCFFASAISAKASNGYEIAPDLTIGGTLRLRYEDKNDFKFDSTKKGNDEDFFLTQLRLNLTWNPSDVFTIFVEGQDARIFGEDTINEHAVPTVFADDFDLHQGYVDLTLDGLSIPTKIRIGRQKFNLGAKRLVASLEWVNTARVWDGVRVTLGEKSVRTFDMITSRLVAVDSGNLNDWAKTGNRLFNSDFHTLYFTDWNIIPNTRVEGYGMLRHESKVNDKVYTIGSRFDTKSGNWAFNGELAFQFGDFGGLDHNAHALHIEGGYRIEDFNNSTIGMAYNFATGDSNPSDRDHDTFDNQYPLNHAYYGVHGFLFMAEHAQFRSHIQNEIDRKTGLESCLSCVLARRRRY